MHRARAREEGGRGGRPPGPRSPPGLPAAATRDGPCRQGQGPPHWAAAPAPLGMLPPRALPSPGRQQPPSPAAVTPTPPVSSKPSDGGRKEAKRESGSARHDGRGRRTRPAEVNVESRNPRVTPDALCDTSGSQWRRVSCLPASAQKWEAAPKEQSRLHGKWLQRPEFKPLKRFSMEAMGARRESWPPFPAPLPKFVTLRCSSLFFCFLHWFPRSLERRGGCRSETKWGRSTKGTELSV